MVAAADLILNIRAIDQGSGSLFNVRRALLGVGVAAAGLGIASIASAANFEQAMDQVGAVANATEGEMSGLSDEALRIGRETAFGAGEAARAMEILAANGISARDIMGGAARAAVDLAAAGGTDLRTAADLASTAMAVWGLRTTDLTDVVNRMAGAANVSRFGVEDMALAVAQGGGAAVAAGVEFGDFTTAIAAIAPSFSSGSDAGTSFKTFLISLTGTSDSAKEKMRELGIITDDGSNRFFDAAGNMRSMADVASTLRNAVVGLSEQERIQALQTIFGTDAMRAAGAMAQLTKGDFERMDATMRETDAAAISAQRMSNLKGGLEELKGTVEVLMIEFGTQFLPVLTAVSLFLADNLPSAVETATDVLRALSTPVVWIIDHWEPLIPLFAAVGATILAVMVPAVIAWTVAEWAKVAALTAAAAAFIAANAPLIAIGLAIGILVGAIVLLVLHWDQVSAAVQGFIDRIMDFPVVGEIIGHVIDFVRHVVGTLIALFGSIIGVARNVISFFQNVFTGDWEGAWQDIQDIAVGILNTFLAYLHFAFLDDLGRMLVDAIPGLLQKGRDLFQGILDGLTGFWTDTAQPWVTGLPQLIFNALGDLTGFLAQKGRDLLQGLWNGLIDHWQTVVLALVGGIPGLIIGILEERGLGPSLLFQKGRDLLQGLWDGMTDLWESAFSLAFQALPALIVGTLGSLTRTLFSQGIDLLQGLWDGLRDLWDREVRGWLNIAQKVRDAVGNVRRTLGQKGSDLISGLWDGMRSLLEGGLGMLAWVASIGGRIADALIGGFRAAWNAAASGINSAIPNFIGFSTPFGDVGIDLPDNPIPTLARGGIVTRPTLALLGERGDEAVVPLSRGGGMGAAINVYTFDSRPATIAHAVRLAALELGRDLEGA